MEIRTNMGRHIPPLRQYRKEYSDNAPKARRLLIQELITFTRKVGSAVKHGISSFLERAKEVVVGLITTGVKIVEFTLGVPVAFDVAYGAVEIEEGTICTNCFVYLDLELIYSLTIESYIVKRLIIVAEIDAKINTQIEGTAPITLSRAFQIASLPIPQFGFLRFLDLNLVYLLMLKLRLV